MKSLNELESILHISFNNKNLLKEALTHRSYLNEAEGKGLSSNERLEFLGDAVLSFWVSNIIFNKFPSYPEGKLTFIRTHLVRTTTLTSLARKLFLGDFLLLSKGEEQGEGRKNPALLANTFEALIGAIFTDKGIAVVSTFLEYNFNDLIYEVNDTEALKDGKSLLQEKVQAKGSSSPIYKLISSTGPDHQKTFAMGVFIDDKLISEGESKSKQEAEEIAAKKALEILS